jgi:hypothetical protein
MADHHSWLGSVFASFVISEADLSVLTPLAKINDSAQEESIGQDCWFRGAIGVFPWVKG